ncbi:hypothetical protein HK405_004091, partial [Cladochytrium tenue]
MDDVMGGTLRANAQASNRLLVDAFEVWKRATQLRTAERHRMATAVNAHNATILRRALAALHAAATSRRQAVTEAATRFLHARTRAWFTAWADAARACRARAARVREADDMYRRWLLCRGLGEWRLVHQRCELARRADSICAFRRARNALKRWSSRWRFEARAARLVELADGVAVILDRLLLNRVLGAWREYQARTERLRNGASELSLRLARRRWGSVLDGDSAAAVRLTGAFHAWRRAYNLEQQCERRSSKRSVRAWIAWRSRLAEHR